MMIAVKGQFDGQQVKLSTVPLFRKCPVIVIFEEDLPQDDDREVWHQAQESVFAKAWDNQDDAVYDNI